ncbi:MAG TPA: hypothetical protein VH815_06585, partial [Acidobacteriota bacterium]
IVPNWYTRRTLLPKSIKNNNLQEIALGGKEFQNPQYGRPKRVVRQKELPLGGYPFVNRR